MGDNIENAMSWVGDGYMADTNITGNKLDNLIVGSYASNILDGGEGNDVIAGFGGDDLLKGGLGSDVFVWSQQGYEGVIGDFTAISNGSTILAKDKIALAFTPVDDGAVGAKALQYDFSNLNSTQFTMNSGTNMGVDMSKAQVIYDQSTGLLQIDIPVWDMNSNSWGPRDGQADAQMFVNADANGALPTLTAIDNDGKSETFGDFMVMSDSKDWTHHPMT
jgi:Ca2+-binding RTX toxin-like protein